MNSIVTKRSITSRYVEPMRHLTRSRQALLTAAAFLALSIGFVSTGAHADDFDTARNARFTLLVGPSTLNTADPAISAQISAIDDNLFRADGKGPQILAHYVSSPTDRIFDNLALNSSANISATYNQLKSMMVAYSTNGSAYEGDATIRAKVINACVWMNANKYGKNIPLLTSNYNWYDYEIASPLALNDIMVLLYPTLNVSEQADYIPKWTDAIRYYAVTIKHPQNPFTGANKVWNDEILALRGVLIKDSTEISNALTNAISAQTNSPGVLDIVSSGEGGFYADGSYIQHLYYAYNGGYGLALMNDFINVAAIYTGTPWAYSPTVYNKISQRLLKNFAPFIYKGQMMDGVRGRNMSRHYAPSHQDGRTATLMFLQAAEAAAPNDALALRRAAKYWLQTDTTFASYTSGFPIRGVLLAQAVNTNGSIAPMDEPTGFDLYSGMDRAVHLRPGWGASVSMFSTRRKDHETLANQENLKGWHTGDGMLYIYDADLNQYSKNFWPNVNNYYHLGTTVLENTSQAGDIFNTSSFAGGVPSWDGAYGLAALQDSPTSVAINAKKTYFFLDNQILALGADISSTSTTPVRTVVANRQLTATGNNAATTASGTSTANPVADPATWFTSTPNNYLHIAGNVAGSDYGVYFPTAVSLDLRRETRIYNWSTINTKTSPNPTPVASNFYYATINHGASPNGASYAFAIMPNISLAALQSYASAPEVNILENSANAQAIADSKLGVTAAVFWQTATKTVGSGAGSITSNNKSAVFTTLNANTVAVNVTDPTQTNTGTIRVTLGQSAAGVIDKSPAITVVSTSPNIVVDVATAGLKGQPASAIFGLTSTANIVVDNATNTGGSTISSTGTWTASTTSPGYNGSNYVTDGNANKGASTFTFRPSIATAGKYIVQIKYTSDPNRASNVPVTVNGSSATHNLFIDETIGGNGTWTTVGAFNFAVGTSGTIVVSNAGTDGYVVADAVRLFLQ